MERAFQETYGFPLTAIMKHEDLAIGSYRRAVSGLIPRMTTVALVYYRGQMQKENPTFDRSKFVYRLNRTEYEKDYGRQYAHPGFGSHLLAATFEILPKIGPLKVFALKVPDPKAQDIYIKSINGTVDKFNAYLDALKAIPVDGGHPQTAPDLAEIDLDTGKPAEFGEYRLADQTYAKLLHILVTDPKVPMLPDVRKSLADFYAKRSEPAWYQRKPKDWQALEADLKTFDHSGASPKAPHERSAAASPAPDTFSPP